MNPSAIKHRDRAQRELAIDPRLSCIVQAPAGSGKTELLTRRFLALLAIVEKPEEILAITFTRKAAAEMRQRILESLHRALLGKEPESTFEKENYRLAQAAIRRNVECGWKLLEDPFRLRVQTIDAFSASLVRQMPLLSQFGSMPETIDDPRELYHQACDDMLIDLLAEEDSEELHRSLETLLTFLDNRIPRLRRLIGYMLAKRDQWLRHLPHTDDFDQARAYFERVIGREVEQELAMLQTELPREFGNELLGLLAYAEANRRIDSPDGDAELSGIDRLPAFRWNDLKQWQHIADFLLIKDKPQLRRNVNKNIGFPAGNKGEPERYGIRKSEMQARKRDMQELLSNLTGYGKFIECLGRIRHLPTGAYREDQWRLLEALTRVLKAATAYLQLNFHQHNKVDFIEVAERALSALGKHEYPSDLALSLDYRIHHLLVDEFQDTSLTQYRLFEKLTMGWQPEDGHSFFAVGDPMQSIYRFREAQVGLFIKAREQGLGNIPLKALTLSVNFRSGAQIVEWINRSFQRLFPAKDNTHLGAVSYTKSVPVNGEGKRAFVKTQFIPDGVEQDEARTIAQICLQNLESMPEEEIAILLRARSQADAIVAALQDLSIAYSAVDIELLENHPAVRDILSLLKAYLHPADRLHWLAVLRAPWCGLTLNDCYDLLRGSHSESVWTLMNDEHRCASLSADGRIRLERIRQVLRPVMNSRLRGPIAYAVESLWCEIGGQECIKSPTDQQAVELCFELIRNCENEGLLFNEQRLHSRLAQMYAPPSSDPEVRVHIMTIHKSKGLEYPTVILPGLHRQSARDSKQLLNYVELAGEDKESDILLAPMDDIGENDPVLKMVLNVEKSKAENELLRLLYVACTRAKDRLYLTACIACGNADEQLKIRSGSLLAALRPAIESDLSHSFVRQEEASESGAGERTPAAPRLRRLRTGWRPSIQRGEEFQSPATVAEESIAEDNLEFLWAGETARRVGTVVHRQLQRIGEDGLEHWSPERIHRNREHYRQLLRDLGVNSKDINSASARVTQSLETTIEDQRGRWILSQEHLNPCSERALTGIYRKSLINIVIDRTFVDQSGTRWIIDYKTGLHSGGGLDEFLDREVERYKNQLNTYAEIFRQLENRPIRLGLYFPLYGAWREWPAES